jgi:type IV fimbrial biogenesis protein FimT
MKFTLTRMSGFTLIESMIGIALISIVAILSIQLGDTIKNERASSSVRELLSSINLARSEAITRGYRVTICKRSENTDPNINQCDTESDNTWENGWIVFADTTPGAAPNINVAEDTILRVSAPLNSRLTLAPNRPLANYVSFNNLGMTRKYNNAMQLGSFFLCDVNEGYNSPIGRRVIINAIGRVRLEKTKGYSRSDANDVPAICNS